MTAKEFETQVAELRAELAAEAERAAQLTARVATLETEIGSCKNVQSVRYGAAQRALVEATVAKHAALSNAEPAERAQLIAASSQSDLRGWVASLSFDKLLGIVRAQAGAARAALIEAVGINNPRARQRLEIYLAPAPKLMRIAAQQQGGRRWIGSVWYGAKNLHLLSMDGEPWVGTARALAEVLEDDAPGNGGNGGVAERIANGVLVVTELPEAEAYAWAAAQQGVR